MEACAARLTDMTVHGGVITQGCPTVLIGDLPAARMGDLHTCPMFDGPKPHVGGVIAMGRNTVFIGDQPAACVGDMASCAGPPDTIAFGCPTVLIGDVGRPVSITVNTRGIAVAGAQASSAVAATDNNESISHEPHWVAFEFVDRAGLPVSGNPYRFTDPDANDSEGVLRLDGTVRRDALSEGACTVVVMNVSQARWSTDEARVGETVELSAHVDGFDDGTEALFQIFKRDLKVPDVVVGEIRTTVEGDTVEGEWDYELPGDVEDEEEQEGSAEAAFDEYSAPEYYFEVLVGRCQARSGMLRYKDYIDIELRTDDGQPVPNEVYMLYLPNGEVRRGTLDGSGRSREERVPPGDFRIVFPEANSARRAENTT